MKTSMRKLSVLLLAATLGSGFTFSGMAHAKPDGEKNQPRHELTQEQRDSAKKIFAESRAATAETRKALDAKKSELDALLKNENPDKAKIVALSREIGELRGKLAISKMDTKTELKKAGLPESLNRKDLRDDSIKGKLVEKMRNLTDEQKAVAKKILDDNRAATMDAKKAMDAKKRELSSLLNSGTPDKAKIETLSAEIGGLRGELIAAHLEMKQQLKKAGLPEDLFERDKNKDMRKDKRKNDRGGDHGGNRGENI